jgi:hypothetical protein
MTVAHLNTDHGLCSLICDISSSRISRLVLSRWLIHGQLHSNTIYTLQNALSVVTHDDYTHHSLVAHTHTAIYTHSSNIIHT